MDYLAVKDLKKTKELWQKLEREKELVITKVLVSGLIRANGPPGRIVDLMGSGSLRLVVDDRILGEYRDPASRENPAEVFPTGGWPGNH